MDEPTSGQLLSTSLNLGLSEAECRELWAEQHASRSTRSTEHVTVTHGRGQGEGGDRFELWHSQGMQVTVSRSEAYRWLRSWDVDDDLARQALNAAKRNGVSVVGVTLDDHDLPGDERDRVETCNEHQRDYSGQLAVVERSECPTCRAGESVEQVRLMTDHERTGCLIYLATWLATHDPGLWSRAVAACRPADVPVSTLVHRATSDVDDERGQPHRV